MPLPGTPEENIHFIQDKLHTPVVKVKRKLIEYLFIQFLLHQIAKEGEQAGKPDFIAYINDLSLKLPELLPDLLKSFSLESEAPLQEVLRLASFRYIPPTDPISLKNDLWWLSVYWQLWPVSRKLLSKEAMEGDIGLVDQEPFEGFEGFLDLSLAKIAFRIGFEVSNIRLGGKNKEAIVRLNLTKKYQSETQRGMIYSVFANVRKEAGDTLNRIVGRIYTSLQKIDGPPYKSSKKTIERALKDNPQLMEKCFSKETRGAKSRFIYIRHTSV